MVKRIKPTEKDRQLLKIRQYKYANKSNGLAEYYKVIVRKPWGHEYLVYNNDTVSIWMLYLNNGFQTSMHCHPRKKTSIVILAGKAVCSTLNGDFKLKIGDGLLLEEGVFHTTKALSSEGVLMMETETPVDKKDLLRLYDMYGRENMGYENEEFMVPRASESHYSFLDEPLDVYGQEKYFGDCCIYLMRLTDSQQLQSQLPNTDLKLLTLLKGRILDRQGKVLFTHGDLLDFKHYREKADIYINEEVEILLIRR